MPANRAIMIFGNPDTFAIYVDKVQDWSYPDFDEGVFAYVLQNELFPKNPFGTSSTLGVYHGELTLLKNNIQANTIENEQLFGLDDDQLYQALIDISYPAVPDEQDLRHFMLIGEMADGKHFVFAVSYHEKIKFVYLNDGKPTCIECNKTALLESMTQCLTWFSTQTH